ncbi:MAG: TldD/PmbA family protein [Actinomycetota bacterium]
MGGLIGPDEIRRVTGAALELSKVDGVEVLVMHEWGGLTRFARSAIHQNTWSEDTEMRVRVVTGGRTAVAATNDLTAEGALKAAKHAREMAMVAAPDPDWPGLAPAAPAQEKDAFDDATASVTPEARAETVARLVAACPDGFHAAGAHETGAMEVVLASTEGQFCYAPATQTSITTVIAGGDGGTGFAETFAGRIDEIDATVVGERAATKAASSEQPRDIEPGEYDVVLEPAATSTLVGFLSYLGFGGRALIEGRSCLSGKEGDLVAAPAITMADDALDPDTLGLPFDFEGTPRRRIELIRDGVFRSGVTDRRTAKQSDTESTGHALPPPEPEGPFPLNVRMEPGDASMEELIASTERGLLVTRFHYSNVVEPTTSVITGMTRDGTFMIEGGRIAYPVKNLRFTQSILEALTNTRAIGRDLELASEFFFSASLVPALAIDGFRFSSVSDH